MHEITIDLVIRIVPYISWKGQLAYSILSMHRCSIHYFVKVLHCHKQQRERLPY